METNGIYWESERLLETHETNGELWDSETNGDSWDSQTAGNSWDQWRLMRLRETKGTWETTGNSWDQWRLMRLRETTGVRLRETTGLMRWDSERLLLMRLMETETQRGSRELVTHETNGTHETQRDYWTLINGNYWDSLETHESNGASLDS